MNKIIIGIVILLAVAAPLFAQGSFSDVPTDHWAYDAVNKLQADGIIIGYPDGTFSGKRPLTRFEFAAALARAIPVLETMINKKIESMPTNNGSQPPVDTSSFAKQSDLEALQNRVDSIKMPGNQDLSGYVLKQDFDKLQALVNEFRDEIAGLGVDVDTMKRDIAALNARLDAVEKQLNRQRIGVDFMVAGVATQENQNNAAPAFDRDDRPLQLRGLAQGKLINSVSMVRDFDLTLTSALGPSVSANMDVSFGNYLPAYLGGVINDYVGTERSSQVRTPAGAFSNTDSFVPYYTYVTAGLGKGALKVGRMPMQLTPYTLKLIDVDSYLVNDKLDSGNYPLDGGTLSWKLGPVGLMGFAAKCDQNSLLGPSGLVSQPTSGLYNPVATPAAATTYTTFYTTAAGGLLPNAGHAAGGLTSITQVGGGRLSIGTPFHGTLGATYFSAVGPPTSAVGVVGLPAAGAGYDRVDVWGGDLNVKIAVFPIAVEYAESRTKDDAHIGVGLAEIKNNNKAIDGKVGFALGKLNLDAGYRTIGNNFGAPGYWGKIGRWANPTNIKGYFGDLNYGLTPGISLVANGQFYKGDKSIAVLPAVLNNTGDKVWKAEGGLKWGFAGTSNLNVGYEYVQWEPNDTGALKSKEQYINIGIAHQLNPNMGVNISYQIIDYKPQGSVTPYGTGKYKGGVAVAEIKTKF